MAARGVMRAALVGQGIAGSRTPAMHMAEGRALGLDYTYEIIDTSTATHRGRSLSDIIDAAQADGLVGLNITHPYKVEIVRHLDDLSEIAGHLGAVNTVVFHDGKRYGHNTDYSGFASSFRQYFGDVQKHRVLLLGAGGAGAAVAFALLECAIGEIQIYDVATGRSQRLVEKLRRRFPSQKVGCMKSLTMATTRNLNGFVNATPAGMDSHPGSALPLELLSSDKWVADIVYLPIETALLKHARGLGCRVMSGEGMAVFQAAYAFELFTGHRANAQRLAETFHLSGGNPPIPDGDGFSRRLRQKS